MAESKSVHFLCLINAHSELFRMATGRRKVSNRGRLSTAILAFLVYQNRYKMPLLSPQLGRFQRALCNWSGTPISVPLASAAAEVIGEEAGKDYRQLQKQIDELRAEIKTLKARSNGA